MIQTTVIAEEQEPHQRRLLGFFRRDSESAELSRDSSADVIDQVESHLTELGQAWDEHDSLLTDFICSPENQQLYDQLIDEGFGKQPNRMSSRHRARKLDGDFVDLAVLYLTDGRLLGTRSHRPVQGGSSDGTLSLRNGLKTGKQSDLIDAKLSGIFDNLRPTPSLVSARQMFVNLRKASKQSTAKILKAEDKFFAALNKHISSDPYAASEEVIASFLACADSDVQTEQVFARTLAAYFTSMPESSILEHALKEVEEQPREKALGRFIADKMLERERDVYSLIGRLLASQGSEDPGRILGDNFEHWPEEMKRDFTESTAAYKSGLRKRVGASSQRALQDAGYYLTINLDVFEQAVDRLYKKVHGKDTVLESNKVQVPKGARTSMTPSDYLTPGRTDGNETSFSLISDGIDPALAKRFSHVLEAISLNPNGRGIRSLKGNDVIIKVGGKQYRQRSAAPERMPGVPPIKEIKAGDARVVFVVTSNRQVIIKKIFTRHKDYNNWLGQV